MAPVAFKGKEAAPDNRSAESTRPATAWTSTSDGSSSPSVTLTRSETVEPSSAVPFRGPSETASTWSTATAGHAARTRAFHAASSRAAIGSSDRWASAAGA